MPCCDWRRVCIRDIGTLYRGGSDTADETVSGKPNTNRSASTPPEGFDASTPAGTGESTSASFPCDAAFRILRMSAAQFAPACLQRCKPLRRQNRSGPCETPRSPEMFCRIEDTSVPDDLPFSHTNDCRNAGLLSPGTVFRIARRFSTWPASSSAGSDSRQSSALAHVHGSSFEERYRSRGTALKSFGGGPENVSGRA